MNSKSKKLYLRFNHFGSVPKTSRVHNCIVVPAGLKTFFEEIGQAAKPGEFLEPPAIDRESVKTLHTSAEKRGHLLYPPTFPDYK